MIVGYSFRIIFPVLYKKNMSWVLVGLAKILLMSTDNIRFYGEICNRENLHDILI